MVKKLEDMSYDPEVIGLYDKERIDKFVHDVDMHYAREEGIEEGIEQNKLEIAKNMLDKKMGIEIISEITGLTKEEIEELR